MGQGDKVRIKTLARAICLVTAAASLHVAAEQLNIDAIFGGTSLAGPTPRGVRMSPDGNQVGFLRGRAQDQYQLDLWVYDLDKKSTHRLVDSRELVPEEELTDAEKAMRERARTAGLRGIIDYQWSSDGRKLLFPLGKALYFLDLDKQSAGARKLVEGEGLLDPKISPKGHYVSWVRDQNLYVIDLATNAVRQLTQDGKGTVHNGEAEFVAQEEMDQHSGYWWSPDDASIAFKQYDEAQVPEAQRFEIYADRTEVIRQRYPYAGAKNVTVKLGVSTLKDGSIRWLDLGGDADIYLPRVSWMNASTLTFQRESRNQQSLELIAADLASGKQAPLLSESSATWINLHNDLRFLKKRDAFIWASERSGNKHLYLHDRSGKQVHPLTTGDWNVDHVEAVDEAAGVVYFSANLDAVTDKQLYAVKLDGSNAGKPVRVSREDGWHDVSFAGAASKTAMYVDTWSDAMNPPKTAIRGMDGKVLSWIEENKLDAAHPYSKYLDAHIKPEFGTLKAEDGQTLQYRMYKPLGFEASKRYPVFIKVYGGPTTQLVNRGWNRDLFDEYMAQRGYVVFTLDNRGSSRRSRAFSDAIYKHLGRAEVADQLAGIHWLKSQPFVDSQRIGMFGWSYGGYMTLMMLAKASNELAAGVSVAPVTDWSLYDSHYTERFLSSPHTNAAGYAGSKVEAYLDGMTSPLLLVHGMADDNVLFTNSTQLMASLQTKGTQFRLMTYPGGKHGMSTPAMKKHVYHLIADYFDEKVKGKAVH
ncbi:S9 family peptidase [Burkholderiaceae bacterium DAT-1]|nr:S9 family peptidase [Burkholderiaceae bacterium DAT-1]